MKLEGKRVLITGGSSGIGFAIAQALLAKHAKVAVTGRRSTVLSAAVDELRKGGGSVAGIAADIGTGEGRALTLKRALDALGGLDILINNAGGVRAGRLEAFAEPDDAGKGVDDAKARADRPRHQQPTIIRSEIERGE